LKCDNNKLRCLEDVEKTEDLSNIKQSNNTNTSKVNQHKSNCSIVSKLPIDAPSLTNKNKNNERKVMTPNSKQFFSGLFYKDNFTHNSNNKNQNHNNNQEKNIIVLVKKQKKPKQERIRELLEKKILYMSSLKEQFRLTLSSYSEKEKLLKENNFLLQTLINKFRGEGLNKQKNMEDTGLNQLDLEVGEKQKTSSMTDDQQIKISAYDSEKTLFKGILSDDESIVLKIQSNERRISQINDNVSSYCDKPVVNLDKGELYTFNNLIKKDKLSEGILCEYNKGSLNINNFNNMNTMNNVNIANIDDTSVNTTVIYHNINKDPCDNNLTIALEESFITKDVNYMTNNNNGEDKWDVSVINTNYLDN
jgi:hypothetical protein